MRRETASPQHSPARNNLFFQSGFPVHAPRYRPGKSMCAATTSEKVFGPKYTNSHHVAQAKPARIAAVRPLTFSTHAKPNHTVVREISVIITAIPPRYPDEPGP